MKSLSQVNPAFLGYYLSKGSEILKEEPVIAIFPEEKDCLDFLTVLRAFSSVEALYFPPQAHLPFAETFTLTSNQLERLKVLWKLPELKVITTLPEAYLRKTPSRKDLKEAYLYLIRGEEVIRDQFIRSLLDLGYERAKVVEDKGIFSVKGGTIDLFSPQYELPARIEFFGDEVVDLRLFDPQTQRSVSQLEELIILPAREAFFPKDIGPIYERLLKVELKGQPEWHSYLLKQIENRKILVNEDFLLPFLFSDLATLDQNLPKNSRFLLFEPERVWERASKFWEKIEAFAEKARKKGYLLFEPERLYLSLEAFSKIINFSFSQVLRAWEFPIAGEDTEVPVLKEIEIPDRDRIEGGFAFLKEILKEGWEVLFFYTSKHTPEIITEGLLSRGVKDLSSLRLEEGSLARGFMYPTTRLVVTSEQELFGKGASVKRMASSQPRSRFRRFEDLKPGDYVVHKTYGIGRYLGLKTLNLHGMEGDFLEIEYADGDKVFLPPARLDELYPYVAFSDKEPKLDKLGKQTFLKRRKELEKRLTEVVQEILTVYAERRAMKGFALNFPVLAYEEFISTFPYEETPDQARTIEEVISDLCQEKLMERLVVGDVGFGKTEVALRAAFIAAYNGKQVAVLVPTTILAEQHYRTFKERLEKFGLKVGVLSRLRSQEEIKAILEGLAEGEIHVVIGTHKILSSEVRFKDLGLVIVDEEHRFGVKQKEKLKQLKKSTKVLILSATPIPRSLQLSLLGIFDLSIIETPPLGRKAITTYLARFDKEIIKTAIEKELERGGQVYFVHPRIEGLNTLALLVKNLVPEAKVECIHGQLPKNLLEKNIYKFLQREVDVLVCTPIIGSGVDIPTANTIIINRADLFGIADLYQLRGRVGRSEEQAYAYLLVPDLKNLTEEARLRLQALLRHTELGSGFKLAMSDLKIRGSGELLGLNQSGHINAVGYELYLELLENTIRALKGEKIEDWEPEVNLKVQAFIPQNYVPDPEERLSLYRELVVCRSRDEILDFKLLLEDKYGPIPKETENLLSLYQLKQLMKTHGFLQIEEKGEQLFFILKEQSLVPQLRRAIQERDWLSLVKVEAKKGWVKIGMRTKKGPLETALNILSSL